VFFGYFGQNFGILGAVVLVPVEQAQPVPVGQVGGNGVSNSFDGGGVVKVGRVCKARDGHARGARCDEWHACRHCDANGDGRTRICWTI